MYAQFRYRTATDSIIVRDKIFDRILEASFKGFYQEIVSFIDFIC
jgi:hypothetical protein